MLTNYFFTCSKWFLREGKEDGLRCSAFKLQCFSISFFSNWLYSSFKHSFYRFSQHVREIILLSFNIKLNIELKSTPNYSNNPLNNFLIKCSKKQKWKRWISTRKLKMKPVSKLFMDEMKSLKPLCLE